MPELQRLRPQGIDLREKPLYFKRLCGFTASCGTPGSIGSLFRPEGGRGLTRIQSYPSVPSSHQNEVPSVRRSASSTVGGDLSRLELEMVVEVSVAGGSIELCRELGWDGQCYETSGSSQHPVAGEWHHIGGPDGYRSLRDHGAKSCKAAGEVDAPFTATKIEIAPQCVTPIPMRRISTATSPAWTRLAEGFRRRW